MPKSLTFLHTMPIHIATFDRLIAAIDPSIPLRHVVNEDLLNEARAAGSITPAVAAHVAEAVAGAAADTAVVVCTCSTIGGSAEDAGRAGPTPVLRIDRAMAERAVALGNRILVLAALESTLAPTRALIEGVAREQGATPDIAEIVVRDAWPHFEAGDLTGYYAAIAATLRDVAGRADVVVLAQASMAPAAELCPDLAVPVLSSPRLGAEAAVAAYRAATQHDHADR